MSEDPKLTDTGLDLIQGRWLWTGHDLVEGGGVLVDAAGLVVSTGPAETLEQGARARGQHIKSRQVFGEALLMPGLVNSHSHAFQRMFRGAVQWKSLGQDSFWTWRQAMYAAANGLSPQGIEEISERCFAEMLLAGITHVGEFHYLHRDPLGRTYDDPNELALRVIRAARHVGIRITLLRVVYHTGGIEQPLLPDQLRFRTDSVDEALSAISSLQAQADQHTSVGLAPHSIRAVPEAWLAELAEFDGPIHAHVAEQPAEVQACVARYGRGPLQVFADAGLVDERFTAVHLTHPCPEDPSLLREGRAGVCVCPTTEMDLGDGFLPLELRDDISLCVGSDSHAAIDLFQEVRSLEWHARALSGQRNVMSAPAEMAPLGRAALAARLLRAATLDGDGALGGQGAGLRPGTPADLCALSLDHLAAQGVPPLEAAVFNANPTWVSDVWVSGQQVVRGGQLCRQLRALSELD